MAARGLSTAFIIRRSPGFRPGAWPCASAIACAGSLCRGRASALDFGDEAVALAPGDAVILALPAPVAKALLPEITAPESSRAILNADFKIDAPPGWPAILGVIGGTVEWLFAFENRLSVTISGADRLIDSDREELARELLGRGGGAHRPRTQPAGLADRQGAPGDLRRFAGGGGAAAGGRNPLAESAPRGRLDGDGPAGDHRRCDPLWQPGGRIPAIKGLVSGRVAGKAWRPGTTMQAVLSVQPTIADHGASPAEIEARSAGRRTRCCAQQRDDGHWAFELEADATIPAEYILLDAFPRSINPAHEAHRRYLRAFRKTHGGWPLFHDGDFNISASVKAYFALKMFGDDRRAAYGAGARSDPAHGGAANSNVFTRIQLALFGAVPWRGGAGHAGRDHVAAALVSRFISTRFPTGRAR